MNRKYKVFFISVVTILIFITIFTNVKALNYTPQITELIASSAEPNALKIKWDSGSVSSDYSIQIYNSNTGEVKNFASSVKEYTFQSLEDNKIHRFSIRACNTTSCTPWGAVKESITYNSPIIEESSLTDKNTLDNQGTNNNKKGAINLTGVVSLTNKESIAAEKASTGGNNDETLDNIAEEIIEEAEINEVNADSIKIYNIDESNNKNTANVSSLTIEEGQQSALGVSIEPYDSTDKIIWETSNPEVVTVDGGVVTAISEGNATITVKSENNIDSASEMASKNTVPKVTTLENHPQEQKNRIVKTATTISSSISISVSSSKSNGSSLSGKKVYVEGDSIQTSDFGQFLTNASKSLGASVTNTAVRGATLAVTSKNDNNSVYNRIYGKNLSSYDVVFISAGVNDYSWSLPIGSASSSSDTTAGALNKILSSIHSNAPNAKIIVVSPLYKLFEKNDGSYTNCDSKNNNAGNNLAAYKNAIKNVATSATHKNYTCFIPETSITTVGAFRSGTKLEEGGLKLHPTTGYANTLANNVKSYITNCVPEKAPSITSFSVSKLTNNKLKLNYSISGTVNKIQITNETLNQTINTSQKTSYTWSGLSGSKTYNFKIRACSNSKCSAWSSIKGNTTYATAKAPKSFSLSKTSKSITFKYKTNNKTRITIYRCCTGNGIKKCSSRTYSSSAYKKTQKYTWKRGVKSNTSYKCSIQAVYRHANGDLNKSSVITKKIKTTSTAKNTSVSSSAKTKTTKTTKNTAQVSKSKQCKNKYGEHTYWTGSKCKCMNGYKSHKKGSKYKCCKKVLFVWVC